MKLDYFGDCFPVQDKIAIVGAGYEMSWDTKTGLLYIRTRSFQRLKTIIQLFSKTFRNSFMDSGC
jgi:hypothetical protein